MRNNLVSLMLSDTTSQRAQSAAVHCRRPNSFRPASTFFGICRGMRLAYRLCTVGCDSFHNVAQGLWCSTTGRCDPHLGSGSSSAPDHFSPWGSTWDEQWRSGSYGTATFWWHIGSDPFFFFFLETSPICLRWNDPWAAIRWNLSLAGLPKHFASVMSTLATGLQKNSTFSPHPSCIQIAAHTHTAFVKSPDDLTSVC